MTTAKKPYACSRCRASKLRCLLDTFDDHEKCRRCFEAGAECFFEVLAPRQRRRRTDTRVAALEKQVADLTAVVEGASVRAAQLPGGHERGRDQPVHQGTGTAVLERASDEEQEQDQSPNEVRLPDQDVIPGLITSEDLTCAVAKDLLQYFRCNMLHEYPIVELADKDDFATLRLQQPVLLFGIITAASSARDPDLFVKLHASLRRLLAERIFVEGNCTIELVQSMLLMEVWYNPPDDLRRLNFYRWIESMCSMIRQLGLWQWDKKPTFIQTSFDGSSRQELSREIRTAFAVYLSISTASISLGRLSTLRWTDGALATLNAFEQSSESPNDRRLAAWIKLQLIAEDVENHKMSISDTPHQATYCQPESNLIILNSFEQELIVWRDRYQDIINDSLQMHYFYCRIKLYELVIQVHLTQSGLSPRLNPTQCPPADDVNSDYLRMIMSLVQSSHSALDLLLRLDAPTYLKCPTVTTVRALYAVYELHLLQEYIIGQQSYLRNHVTEQVLCVQFYMSQTRFFFERIRAEKLFRVPLMALSVLAHTRDDTSSARQALLGETQPTSQTSREAERVKAPTDEMQSILAIAARSCEAIAVPLHGEQFTQRQAGGRTDAFLPQGNFAGGQSLFNSVIPTFDESTGFDVSLDDLWAQGTY